MKTIKVPTRLIELRIKVLTLLIGPRINYKGHLSLPALAEQETMGISEMQKTKKIQRKKLREEEKIFAEELEILMELSVDEYQELKTEKADEMVLLMKCPPRVDKAWRQLSSPSSSFPQELVLVAKYRESFGLLLADLSPEVIR